MGGCCSRVPEHDLEEGPVGERSRLLNSQGIPNDDLEQPDGQWDETKQQDMLRRILQTTTENLIDIGSAGAVLDQQNQQFRFRPSSQQPDLSEREAQIRQSLSDKTHELETKVVPALPKPSASNAAGGDKSKSSTLTQDDIERIKAMQAEVSTYLDSINQPDVSQNVATSMVVPVSTP